MTDFGSAHQPSPTPDRRRRARLWIAGAIVASVLVVVVVALTTGSVLAGLFTLMGLGVASMVIGLVGLAILSGRRNRS